MGEFKQVKYSGKGATFHRATGIVLNPGDNKIDKDKAEKIVKSMKECSYSVKKVISSKDEEKSLTNCDNKMITKTDNKMFANESIKTKKK